tara:strand:- start:131 stop:292 length:162 start_codon:yes stop_codon:yes gene_type:complete
LGEEDQVDMGHKIDLVLITEVEVEVDQTVKDYQIDLVLITEVVFQFVLDLKIE